MILAVMYLAAAGLLSWWEVTRIRRYGGGTREIVVHVVASALAVGLGVLLILGVPVPNPAQWIVRMFAPLNASLLGRP